MRYHYEKPELYSSVFGTIHTCNHPVYDKCALYLIGRKGLAVIQQRYDPDTKHTYWTKIDPWLTDQLYLHPGFKEFFDDRARDATDDLYPTVTIRQIMWTLKMKPIPRERRETCFNRRDI